MSEQPNGSGRKVHWDPTIRLDTLITVAVMLVAGGAAYATLDVRTAQNTREIVRVEEAVGKATVRVENVLMNKITDVQAGMNQTQIRTAEDVREIKMLIRDLGRDLDAKLDRKVDKPNR